MFVIQEHDDSEMTSRVFCLVERDPEQVVAHLENEAAIFADWYKKYSEHMKDWMEKNPIEYPPLEIKKIKKWKAGIRQEEITAEMRQEREDTKAYNANVNAIFSAHHNNWLTLKEAEADRWKKEVNMPENISQKISSSSWQYYCSYSFRKVEIMELVDGELKEKKGWWPSE